MSNICSACGLELRGPVKSCNEDACPQPRASYASCDKKDRRGQVGALVENAIHHYMEYHRGRCSLDTMARNLEAIKDQLAAPSAIEPRTACLLLAEKWMGYANDKSGRHPAAADTLQRCSAELQRVIATTDGKGQP